MYRVRVFIFLKKSISDSEGLTIQSSLRNLFGKNNITNMRVGKAIDFLLNDCCSEEEMKKNVKKICDKFLVNLVIEEYQFEWEKIGASLEG